MKIYTILLAVIAGLLVGCSAPVDTDSAVEAEPTPPAAPGGAGRGRAAPPRRGGGRQGGRGVNLGFLLRNEQVKKELGITADQANKIETAVPAQGQAGGQDVTPEERQKQREEAQKKVEAILKPVQVQRLRQIELQTQGARALTVDRVAKALGLSADQVKKIEAALEVPRPQDTPGGGFDREAFMKARAEADKKALALLTPAQKTKWDEMLGKKFTLIIPPRGGGIR